MNFPSQRPKGPRLDIGLLLLSHAILGIYAHRPWSPPDLEPGQSFAFPPSSFVMAYLGYIKILGLFAPFPNITQCANLLATYFPNKTYNVATECVNARIHILSHRVSFIVGITNALFIIITTVLFLRQSFQWRNVITLDRRKSVRGKWEREQEVDSQKAKRIPTERVVSDKFLFRRLALLKRSPSSTVVAAIGHFIVSTTFFMLESFDGFLPCYIVLWGSYIGCVCWMFAFVWRALRLRFLISIHKQRLVARTSNSITEPQRSDFRARQQRAGPESSLTAYTSDINIVRWRFLPIKENMSTYSERRFVGIFFILLILTLAYLAITQRYSVRFALDETICTWGWEQYPLMIIFIFFILILYPASLWGVWNHRDANGIREDIIATVIVGIPGFVLYFVWLTIFPDGYTPGDSLMRVYWGASNWPVMVMLVSHFTSIVIPMMQSYGVDYKRWGQSKKEKQMQNMVGDSIWIRNLESYADTTSQKFSKPSLPLTVESFCSTLDDPELFQQLRDFTVKDFCSEISLFLDQYRCLIAQVDSFYQREYYRMDGINKRQNHESLMFTGSVELVSVPTNAAILDTKSHNIPSMRKTGRASTTTAISHRTADRPVPTPLIHEFVRFYRIFIQDHAPLQVHIQATTFAQVTKAIAPFLEEYSLDDSAIPKSLGTVNFSSPFIDTTKSGSVKLPEDESNENPSGKSWHQALNQPADTKDALAHHSIDIPMTPTTYREQRRPTLSTLYSETTTLASPETPATPGSHSLSPTQLQFNNDAVGSRSLSAAVFDEVKEEVFWNIFFNTWPKFVLSFQS
ncbi:hypothetical protein BC937DRAFT_86559 [Endogone sp. FLAS-F59071]|nr:hypothetical protein BC937DRAFT_86559 [Endogone sp. FLAS-F59071]|eukprot:RUS20022.1 hypothetical protein BC937DRAFT_86559 [Endogone sp. FLAS-F59071]